MQIKSRITSTLVLQFRDFKRKSIYVPSFSSHFLDCFKVRGLHIQFLSTSFLTNSLRRARNVRRASEQCFWIWLCLLRYKMGGEDEDSLAYSPTWVVAAVCTLIIAISLSVERLMHFTGSVRALHITCNFSDHDCVFSLTPYCSKRSGAVIFCLLISFWYGDPWKNFSFSVWIGLIIRYIWNEINIIFSFSLRRGLLELI